MTTTDPSNWDEFDSILKANLPGYATRQVQGDAANAVQRAFRNDKHALAQLGTGSGKSFIGAAIGYFQAKSTGKPTIIGTETKALQDQLADKDLPFLGEHIEGLRYAVIKGRANYVCLQKLSETKRDDLQAAVDARKDDESFSGEIVDLGLGEVSELSTSSEECPGKSECPFGDVCYAERAKTRAKTAHVVVANHAVIAADLAVKQAQQEIGIPEDKTVGILPHYGAMILDEAHGFEDSVTNAIGGSVTQGSYTRLVGEIRSFLTEAEEADVNKLVGSVQDPTQTLFGAVAQILARREDKRNTTLRILDRELTTLKPHVTALVEALSQVGTRVKLVKIYNNDKLLQKRKRLQRRIENSILKLRNIATSAEDEMVRWLEVAQDRKGDAICWAPLDVSAFLRENLWNKAPSMLMSATLALGNDFSFIAERLGLDAPDTFNGESPFDYGKQALTFIPQISVPSGASMNQWRIESILNVKDLVQASNGAALLLFTSKTEMKAAYDQIAPMVRKMGHNVYIQGEAPNKVLRQKFNDDTNSVLFALKSFMTGADFKGDTLRLLWINKLPFPVPSDVVLSARIDLADKKATGWNDKGFNKITVPMMALLLLQGFGRGIRTVNDRCVIGIGDSRLYGKGAKSYGSRIMAALPKAPVTTDLSEAIEFLEA